MIYEVTSESSNGFMGEHKIYFKLQKNPECGDVACLEKLCSCCSLFVFSGCRKIVAMLTGFSIAYPYVHEINTGDICRITKMVCCLYRCVIIFHT